MAMSLSRHEDNGLGELQEVSDINVTPFIDVILVLLIIFMVAAPLATVDLPIDLPMSSSRALPRPDKPTYVSIKPDLGLAIGETPVSRAELARALDAADGNRDRVIFVRADRNVHYGELISVLELLREGGYARVKLVAVQTGAPTIRPGDR
jgi:biopolymer transport protein ExbD